MENQDFEELPRATKGKGRDDGKPDADLAVANNQAEIQHGASMLADRHMSRSPAQAIISDAASLNEPRAQEDLTARDRALARSFDAATPMQTTAMDDEVITRLTTLSVSGRYEDTPGDEYIMAAESSAWAGFRRNVVFRQCTACDSERLLFDVFQAPCGHDYCQECLSTLFQLATIDETLFPPRCCRQEMSLESVKHYLSSALIQTFEEKSIEFRSSNRTYCSRPTCSSFISPDNIDGDRARCVACGTHTCTICKNNAHDGDCPEDTATQQTLEMGREQGWQRCYNCRSLIELDVGCNQILCHCGAEFCYLCGQPWKTCDCGQWDYHYRPTTRAQQDFARDQVQLAVERERELQRVVAREREIQLALADLRERYITCRISFISVGGVQLWPALGAYVIDSETVIQAGSAGKLLERECDLTNEGPVAVTRTIALGTLALA
ncbi:hypothetical protein MMC07_009149 [Pseudocyphellaria aurata]|nr:hypothetical protein [Pseudocyphellaria aurata]